MFHLLSSGSSEHESSFSLLDSTHGQFCQLCVAIHPLVFVAKKSLFLEFYG